MVSLNLEGRRTAVKTVTPVRRRVAIGDHLLSENEQRLLVVLVRNLVKWFVNCYRTISRQIAGRMKRCHGSPGDGLDGPLVWSIFMIFARKLGPNRFEARTMRTVPVWLQLKIFAKAHQY